ncbi:MAG: hypothetical protein FWH41_05820, partial [Treponema sp.]|nr:hypothetical protein [Treponema sp.]
AAKIEAAKTGSFYVGGFAGNFCIDKKGSVSDPVITVKNCQSNTHEIIVNMTGAEAIMAGGFAGEFRYSTIPVTNCSSASPITVNAPNTTQCWVGGFAGYSSAKLENCESTEAVDATSSGTLIVGGLVGYSTSAITGCTAKGAVKAVGSGTYLSAGGLAGESVAAITDCYAKGGIVDAYANGGILRAGGLLGCGTTSSASISSSSTAAMSASAALDEYTHATGYVKAVNDGNGNTQTNGEIRAGGLVGYTQGSIDKCYAAGEVYAKSGARHAVGGLVGGALYTSSGGTDTQDTMGTIKNSWANGKVTAIGGVNEHFAGGLVGRTTAAITSCYATGDVDGSETGTVSIALRVGGLVGYAVSRPNPPINATIENCYATGNVKAVTGATSLWAGGLVGRTETSISGSSHATGKVESKNTAYDHFAGGLAGEVVGQINTCDATGELEAENNSNDLYAGGLVGLVTGSIQNSSTDINVKANGSGPNQYVGGLAGEIRGSNITLCSAEGNLDITGTNLRGGGLVGQNTASNTAPSTITQSWSKGNVTAAVNTSSSIGGLLGSSNGTPVSMTQCFSTGFVNIESIGGSVNAGGLAGYFRGNIERSGAKGDVTVTQNEDIVTTINAGGLVGRLNEAGKNITNCYTLGDVTVDYNYSQYAHMAAGGIVGRINGNTVQNSFSAGKVEIKSNTTYAARGGGIIGTFEGGSNSIQRTVALGERITATAGSAVPQDRINAYRISYWNSSSMTFNLNYALEDILIGTRTDGYGFAPATSTATGGTASNENGADVSDATRKTDTFWTGTMGFSSTIWDTAGVNIRGYPVLKDVEGQE